MDRQPTVLEYAIVLVMVFFVAIAKLLGFNVGEKGNPDENSRHRS